MAAVGLAADRERLVRWAAGRRCGQGSADLSGGPGGERAGAIPEESPPDTVDAQKHPSALAFDDAAQRPDAADQVTAAVAVER